MKKNVLFINLKAVRPHGRALGRTCCVQHAAALIAALVFVAVLAGCPGPTNSTPGPLDGTWVFGSYKVIMSGSDFTVKVSDVNAQRGTFVYKTDVTPNTLTFTKTQAWDGSQWQNDPGTPSKYDCALNGSIMVLSNPVPSDSSTTPFVGTWNKQ